jgi:O-antigen ligase
MDDNAAVTWRHWAHVGVLAVLSPFFIFPKPSYWWVFLALVLFWGLGVFLKQRPLTKTVLVLPLMILMAALVVSTLRTPDFAYSLPKIAGLFFGIAFFFAVLGLLRTGKLLNWGLGLFLAGGVGFALIGLLGMPTFKVKHLHFLMKIKEKIPQIDFGLPGAELGFSTNAIGGTLLLIVPLFFVLVIAAWNKRNDMPRFKLKLVLLVSGLMATGGVLLLTQSRGAWAGLFLATVIIGLVLLLRKLKIKKGAAGLVIVLTVLVLIAAVGVYTMSKTDQLQPGLKQVEGTLWFRIHLWNITLPVIGDNPLFGVGLNNFRQVEEVRYFWSSAHNQFLHVAVELGIPALIGYMALLILLGYMCIDVWRKSQNVWLRSAALGLGWGQLAFLFFGLTDAIPLGAKVGIIFWLSTALIAAIHNYVTQEG